MQSNLRRCLSSTKLQSPNCFTYVHTATLFQSLPKGVEDISKLNIRLNTLNDNQGSRKVGKRLGRGIGSGKGKTAGRGHKGQKARSGGGVRPGFEGGTSPLYKRLRKHGFTNNRFKVEYEEMNLSKLQYYVDKGILNANEPITMRHLKEAKIIKNPRHGVKLLAKGKEFLTTPVNIEVSQASKAAIERIEEVGGSISRKYYNRVGMRALLNPDKILITPRPSAPPLKMRHRFDWPQPK